MNLPISAGRLLRDSQATRTKHFGMLAITAAALTLTGCTVPPAITPDDVWLVSPITFDNAVDGEPRNLTDVTYSTHSITGDTAGGFWTESAGSWLHIDGDGHTLRRFNDVLMIEVNSISAVSPTVLVVSRQGGGLSSGIYLFDTADGTWTPVADSDAASGDVAALGDGPVVNKSGDLVTTTPSSAVVVEANWMLDSGSPEAREILATKGACHPTTGRQLTVEKDERIAALPFSCGASAAVWVSETSFVVAIGDEGGTVLARVTMPKNWAR